MAAPELAPDVLDDLLRSAWIVEAARAEVFESWSESEARFDASAALASERAGIVAEALARRERATDAELVGAHARWMRSCALGPQEAFADLFLARLGGWVDAHAAPYLRAGGERVLALGERERSMLSFPSAIPPAPPFEPLGGPPAAPPVQGLLRVGVLGDLHVGSAAGEALARAAVADLGASGADVVVQLGDLTDRGEESQFELAAAILAGLEMPLVTTFGNHDAFSVSEGILSGRERYARFFGREPEGHLFELAGVRLAILDSVDLAVSPFPPYDLVTGAFTGSSGGASVRGALTPAQHDLLAEVAAPGAPPALVFLHHPPQPFTGFPPIVFGLRDADSGRLHATCDSGNVWGVFAGHTHRNHAGRPLDGVRVQEVGAPRDFPFGYALIDVRPDGYDYSFHQISDHDLLARVASSATAIQRRYALGSEDERAFSFTVGG